MILSLKFRIRELRNLFTQLGAALRKAAISNKFLDITDHPLTSYKFSCILDHINKELYHSFLIEKSYHSTARSKDRPSLVTSERGVNRLCPLRWCAELVQTGR